MPATFLPPIQQRPQVRRAYREGREYLVAPLVSIVPGVLPGSQGALYYGPEDIGRNVAAWDGMPLTLGHPMQNGRPVSAKAPGVLARQQVGFVEDSQQTSEGRLKHEAWVDVARAWQVDNRIVQALEAGKPLEVSTGLYTENVPVPYGSYATDHKGRAYDAVATNYRPDHIAILPDERGACSLDDGCGLLVNNTLRGLSWLPVVNEEEQTGPVKHCDCQPDKPCQCKEGGWLGDPVAEPGRSPHEFYLEDVGGEVTTTRKPMANLRWVWNAFCATGEGGGVDPSCSPGVGGGGGAKLPPPEQLKDDFQQEKAKYQKVFQEEFQKAMAAGDPGLVRQNPDFDAFASAAGMEGKPSVSNEEPPAGAKVVYRGVRSQEAADAYASADYRSGLGKFGTGNYFATTQKEAEGYGGNLMRVSIKPDARVVDYRTLKETPWPEKYKSMEKELKGDQAAKAALLGYQVVDVSHLGEMLVIDRAATTVHPLKPTSNAWLHWVMVANRGRDSGGRFLPEGEMGDESDEDDSTDTLTPADPGEEEKKRKRKEAAAAGSAEAATRVEEYLSSNLRCQGVPVLRWVPVGNAEDDGRWVTTEDGNRLYIGGGGTIHPGGPGSPAKLPKDSRAAPMSRKEADSGESARPSAKVARAKSAKLVDKPAVADPQPAPTPSESAKAQEGVEPAQKNWVAPWNRRTMESTAASHGVQLDKGFLDSSHRWAESLTPNENEAVMRYTTSEYQGLNSSLRECASPTKGCLGETNHSIYEAVTSAIDKAPPLPAGTTVHRGMVFQDQEKLNNFIGAIEKSARTGGTFRAKGFSSTSLSDKVPETAIEQYPGPGTKVYMRISARKGALVSAAHFPSGLEVLLPHDSAFRATKVERRSDGAYVIHAEQQ